MPHNVHQRVLARAARILGSVAELRVHLRVSMRDLERWMDGEESAPADVFLRAADVVAFEASASLADTLRRSQDVRRSAALTGAASRETQSKAGAAVARAAHVRARAVKALALNRSSVLAARPRNLSAAQFASAEFAHHELDAILESALNALVNSTAAARANLQLAMPEGLRIVAQIGFRKPFLDFFSCVDHQTPSVCGQAHQRGGRVVVTDVAADPIFVGTPAAKVMLDAGARACQSTPIIAASGRLIGMLSSHYERPHQPTADELQAVDLVSGRAAYWLDEERA